MSEYEARRAFQQIFNEFERKQKVRRGLIGDSNGTVLVADRDGWAYIRYNDSLDQLAIVRYLIPDQFADGTPVVVGKKHPNDPYEQVLGADWAMYAWSPAASTVTDHATPAVDLNDLSPGKVVPTDPTSLSVNVRAFLYVNGDVAVEFGGGAIDLTGNVPGVAGHRLVLVYVDLDTDSLAAADGDIVAVGTDADAPAVPENGLPLGVVDLANAETTIESDDISQYKAMYMSVGEVIDLTLLSDYAQGYIIRGGAADWEAYDAGTNGAVLIGDGTDIISDTTPTIAGLVTLSAGAHSDDDITIDADSKALILGDGQDMDIGYDGTDGYIRTDLVAASDLNIDCGANKTIELQTPVWKDINLGAAMLSLPVATQPDEVQIVDELGANTGIYTWGFAINELVSGVFEMQHDYWEGTDVTFHVHWGGNDAPTGTDYVRWELSYTIVRDDNTINAVTALEVETAYDTQYEWLRSSFAAIDGSTGGVDGGNIHIGDQFFFKLKRIAAVGDAYAGDALVATLGLHYQVDTMGSRQIGTK